MGRVTELLSGTSDDGEYLSECRRAVNTLYSIQRISQRTFQHIVVTSFEWLPIHKGLLERSKSASHRFWISSGLRTLKRFH